MGIAIPISAPPSAVCTGVDPPGGSNLLDRGCGRPSQGQKNAAISPTIRSEGLHLIRQEDLPEVPDTNANERGMPKTRQRIVYQTAKTLAYVVVATMVARRFLTLPENVMHGLNIVETFAMFGVALMSMLLAVGYIRALFARATRLPSSDQRPE